MNELVIRKPVVASILQRSEGLVLYSLVYNLTIISSSGLKTASSTAACG
jgi:hypothetical protein